MTFIDNNELANLRYGFVLSIDDDRLKVMHDVFRKSGLSLPELVRGERCGWHGCCLGHKKIVDTARARNLPWCLNFEDDAYPCKNIKDALLNLDLPDADVWLLGHSRYRCTFEQDDWARVRPGDAVCGTHSILIRNTAYNALSEAWGAAGHADDIWSIVARNFDNIRIMVKRTPLFIQYNDTASVLGGHKGYILYGDHDSPPEGFAKIEDLLNQKDETNEDTDEH